MRKIGDFYLFINKQNFVYFRFFEKGIKNSETLEQKFANLFWLKNSSQQSYSIVMKIRSLD